MTSGTTFRLRLEFSVISLSTKWSHLGSGGSRSDDYTVTGPIDAFDTQFRKTGMPREQS